MRCLTSLPCPDDLMIFNTTNALFSPNTLWDLQLLISQYCLVLPCLPCVRGWCLAFLCPGSSQLHAHGAARSPSSITHRWQPRGSPAAPGPWVGSTGYWAEMDMTYQASSSVDLIREVPTPHRSFATLGCHLLAPSPLLPSQLCQGEMETQCDFCFLFT